MNVNHYFPELNGRRNDLQLVNIRQAAYSNLYMFRVISEVDMQAKSLEIAVKVFLTGPADQGLAATQYSALVSVWPAFQNTPAFALPRPLDFFPDISALVMERVAGNSLQSLFRRLPGSKMASRQCAQHSYKAGQWLYRFHQATRARPGFLDLDHKLAGARKNISRLAGLGFSRNLLEQAAARLDEQAEELQHAMLEQALVHGDFTLDNIIVDQDRTTVLDMTGRDQNAVYHDLATLINSLTLLRLSWPVRKATIQASQDSFLAGYFDQRRFNYSALSFLRLIGLTSVALEILDRRGSQVLARLWIKHFFEHALHEMLKDAHGRERSGKQGTITFTLNAKL